MAPLELLPEWLRQIAVVLPFYATMGFPVELLMGRLDGAETPRGFVVAAAWAAAFAVGYVGGWRPALRRYQAVAG